MKKYAVVSCDGNIDYFSLVPITCFSWSKLGYIPVVITYGSVLVDVLIKYCPQGTVFIANDSIEGVRDSTAAQVSRLYLFDFMKDSLKEDDIIITGDADMVMGKDIFTEQADIVSYGFNITGRTEIPICYVKATVKKWNELMGGTMSVPANGYSDDWNLYWGTDQQILTQCAKQYGMDKILFVDRAGDGNNSGLPLGRWDRYKWEYIPPEIVDIHVIRSPLQNWDKITDMCKHLWPEDDLTWVMKLEKELNK